MVVDLERPLPFPDDSFDGAVADLCLHYFNAGTIAAALAEISRILKPSGCLFARVNSTRDVHYGAGEGLEMERGFYNQAGHYKRFFDKPMIDGFFRAWEITALDQYDIRRHDKPKNVFEIVARKVK
jgi:SAM-dependent methyltransferase